MRTRFPDTGVSDEDRETLRQAVHRLREDWGDEHPQVAAAVALLKRKNVVIATDGDALRRTLSAICGSGDWRGRLE